MHKGLLRLGLIYGVLGLCLIPLGMDLADTGPDPDPTVVEPAINTVLALALNNDFASYGPAGQDTACQAFRSNHDELWALVVSKGWDDDAINRRTFDRRYQEFCAA